MAEPKDKRTRRLRALRRKHLRIARRAKRRRRAALRKVKRTEGARKTRARKDATNALRVYRRHRNKAQNYLADIRARRKSLRARARLKPKSGLVYFEGKQVAGWIAPFLVYAREHGWRGGVTSGYRSYATQWYIYYVRRIRPAAKPGTSNHEGVNYPRGAVDVSDPWTFARITKGVQIGGKHLKHYGPGDQWHFSATGR